MNHLRFNTLSINGEVLSISDAIAFCKCSNSDNLRSMGDFLAEWFTADESIRLQTSGSTGHPKIIEVQKEQMLQSAAMTANFFGFEHGQTALLCLPLTYIAGKMMVVRALYSGLNLLCIEPVHYPLQQLPTSTFIDFAPLVPMQLDEAEDTSAIKTILLGGAPLNPQQEKKIKSLSSDVFHGYGMTETLSHVAVRRINGDAASHIYKALPGIRFETDNRSCLVISAPFVADKVYTNDVVEWIDAESFVWKGRVDNVINSGGVKLFPEAVESRISAIIDKPFFVAAVADEHLGEALCLVIESLYPGAEKAEGLMGLLHENLSRFEHPKHVFFIEKFFRTESGKIQRKKTLQTAINRL